LQIAKGLLDIHNAGKIHKDLHPGNILFDHYSHSCVSDLGMCQPANNKVQSIGVYGVLPYVAPEVLCGYEYTKASDIYSFGIVMNEFLSEEIPYYNISHDYILAINACKGRRPKISEEVPKLFADLIMKCWDVKAENRPTAKELFQILNKWEDEKWRKESEIYPQIRELA
jgi:serine/threonine protein kinase